MDVLSRIEQDVHCVVLKEDARFDFMSIIIPHLDPPEELVKVYAFPVAKHNWYTHLSINMLFPYHVLLNLMLCVQ